MLLLSACGSDAGTPTDPGGGSDVGIVVVSGGAQVALPGERLAQPMVVRLRRPDARPVVGIPIELQPTAGSGEVSPRVVITDAAGEATFEWRLGSRSGVQEILLSAPSVGESGEARLTTLDFPAVDALRTPGLGPSEAIGALVDGQTQYGDRSDLTFVGEGPVLGVGDWRAPGLSRGEVTLFLPGFGMVHRPFEAWTAQPDSVLVPLPDPEVLPVAIWVLDGSFNTGRSEALADLEYANSVFLSEGLGIQLEATEVTDGTEFDLGPELLDFVCAQRNDLRETVGERIGSINVYIVRRVDGVRSRGQACEIGGDFVVLGSLAGPTLLAHEIGHNLGLVHPDFDTEHFDQTNIMHSASDRRDSLTEGQIFRAQLSPRSIFNEFTQVYDESELRSCPFTASAIGCPPFEMRLFPDGPFGVFLQADSPLAGVVRRVPPLSLFEHALLHSCGLEEAPAGTETLTREVRFDVESLERALREGPPLHLLRSSAGESDVLRSRRSLDVTWRDNAARALAARSSAR